MKPALHPPNVKSARQAIHAIRGYEYQILAATLAWVDLQENGQIYLEVAEDFAQVVGGDIEAVQVKATRGSGSVTLNTPAVVNAIESFVDLTEQNPNYQVQLRFLTTSPIGLEKPVEDRPGGMSGLLYWQRVRGGRENVGPLRSILERESSPSAIRAFCKSRTDEELHADLIRRITWDCGRPETSTLRRELQERVGRFIQKQFSVPLQEALPITGVLASRVLQRSAMPDARDRLLSHEELLQLAESATRVSLSRADFDRLLRKALVAPDTPTSGQAIVSTQDRQYPPWIVDATALPKPSVLIRRAPLEGLVRSALKSTGLCFIVGPTGTGKSILAGLVADTFPGPHFWVDLRDADSSEARKRLNQLFALLAEFGPATLILDDLNCMPAPTVQFSLGEVVGAARRRDMRIIVTSYARPTATILNRLGAEVETVVSTSHFSLEETLAMISILGGNPKVWGTVAHVAGGSGHPQLTHAFIAGMAAKGWPANQIPEIVGQGFTNTNLEDEHSAVRTNLINSLPEPARELLYRLSIATAPFQRSLAVTIGELQPRIERASEYFDELVDRWLETPMADRFRTSPLVRGLGQKMLTTDQQRQVHDKIATDMTSRNDINAADIDSIIVHGLAGESQQSLFKLSHAVNLADDQTRRSIANYLAVFPALDTSKPIYPKDLPTSVLLRLAQLRLAVATEKRHRLDDIATALLREAEAVPHDPVRPDLRMAVLGSVLNNAGIARHVQNWVDLLSRFRRLNRQGHDGVITRNPDTSPAAALFSIGISGLDSVKTLEAVFEALSRLEYDERRELLTPIDASVQDYHLLIHHPWTARSRQPDFNAAEAVESYKRMGALSDSWGLHTLSIQCRVAVAMILDEHLDETERALHVLDEAGTKFGRNAVLTRALAKLHYRNGHGAEALRYFRDAVAQMSVFGPVDAVYTVREAAVCAAECGEWDMAHNWFLRAQAASDPLSSIGRGAIGVGLFADAAVATFHAGNLQKALSLLKDALRSLQKIEADSNLQAAHCHRLIRHTILWLRSKVRGLQTKIAGEPIAMLPGACSNPEPVPEIEQRPLGHIDFAWYMLAEIELASGLDVGIRNVVTHLGGQGYIPIQEHAFRIQDLGVTISAQNPIFFSSKFSDYLASATYCTLHRDALRHSIGNLNPRRVAIPALSRNGSYDPVTETLAHNAILAYAVRSILVGEVDAIDQLRDSLSKEFGNSHPGKYFFDNWDAGSADTNDIDAVVRAIMRRCIPSESPPPDLIFQAGLRILTWLTQSPFRSVLIPHLKPWLMAHWKRILRTQRFLLYTPASTVPPIREVLRSELEGEQFAASLTLVAAAAVRAPLSAPLRRDVVHLAHGKSH